MLTVSFDVLLPAHDKALRCAHGNAYRLEEDVFTVCVFLKRASAGQDGVARTTAAWESPRDASIADRFFECVATSPAGYEDFAFATLRVAFVAWCCEEPGVEKDPECKDQERKEAQLKSCEHQNSPRVLGDPEADGRSRG